MSKGALGTSPSPPSLTGSLPALGKGGEGEGSWKRSSTKRPRLRMVAPEGCQSGYASPAIGWRKMAQAPKADEVQAWAEVVRKDGSL